METTSQQPPDAPPPQKRKVRVVVPKRNEGKGIFMLGRNFATGQHDIEVTEAEYAKLLERESLGVAVVALDNIGERGGVSEPAGRGVDAQRTQLAQDREDFERERARFLEEKRNHALANPGAPVPPVHPADAGGLIPDEAPEETKAEQHKGPSSAQPPGKKRY